jgi:hypothetical protein
VTCTVAMDQAKNVTANFTAQATKYTLRVRKQGRGSGTVTSTPAGIACGSDCRESFASGTSVNLSAIPASGSTFRGWTGACSGTGACTVTLTESTTVTATFQRPR